MGRESRVEHRDFRISTCGKSPGHRFCDSSEGKKPAYRRNLPDSCVSQGFCTGPVHIPMSIELFNRSK
ncbi:hypothetical protein [Synechococcus sp. M16CYN]|uniref:hypothetical protein n=1 Tax=Synechococcus sp. M16CYN TaxID=3103139 RepID=UPI00333F6DFD